LLRSTPLMLTCSLRDGVFTFSGSLRGKTSNAPSMRHERYTALVNTQ
jgi:hypothetical protein